MAQSKEAPKSPLTHHDDAITSAQEIWYYVVCTSHGIVMMSQSNFLVSSLFGASLNWAIPRPYTFC